MHKKSVNIWSKNYSEKIFEDEEVTHLKITGIDLQIEGRVDLQFFKTVLKDDLAFENLTKVYPKYFKLSVEITKRMAKINNHYYPRDIGFPELEDKETIADLEKEISERIAKLTEYRNFLSEIIIDFESKLLKIGYPCFRYGSLKSLSPKIVQLKNLKELDLSYNCLDKLPDEIGEMKKLKFINLSYNCFTEFPKVLLKLKNIRYINLEKNPLKKIPKKFKNIQIKLEKEKIVMKKEKLAHVKNQAFQMAAQIRDIEKKTGFFVSSKHFFNYLPLLAEILYNAEE